MLAGAKRGEGAITRKPRSFSMVRGLNDSVEPPMISIQDNGFDATTANTAAHRNLIMTPQAKGNRRLAIAEGNQGALTVGSLEGTPDNSSGEKRFSTVRVNLRSENNSRSPVNRLMGSRSFQPPKPHKNELNDKAYDVAGAGTTVHDLTDNIE